MASFSITPDPYNYRRDTITSNSNQLKLTVIDPERERNEQETTKYCYLVVYGIGKHAVKLHFIVGNTELSIAKAIWDRQLLLSAIHFYQGEKDHDELTFVKNLKSGNVIYLAEGVYFESLNLNNDYSEKPGGWS
jgi:hypothetical protein